MTTAKAPITLLLQAWRQGDKDALNRMTPLVYDELYRLAAAYMRHERPGHTFSPTALVSEAYLRLQRCGLTLCNPFFAIPQNPLNKHGFVPGAVEAERIGLPSN